MESIGKTRLRGDSMRSNLTAMILAGGLSSRMGRDKALIEINGIPLLQRVCSVVQQCTPQIYIVTPWNERYQPIVSGKLADERKESAIQFLTETQIDSDHSPLTGFLQGLSQLPPQTQSDWVLLLACDLPNLDAAILQQWIATLPDIPATVTACLPKNSQGWWEPLCGFYRSNCQPRVAAFVAEGGRSFQHWLAQESVDELPLSQPSMLLNCNTPADLQAL